MQETICSYSAFIHKVVGKWQTWLNSVVSIGMFCLICLLAALCLTSQVNAQAPIINPKTNVILPLDGSGNRMILPADVATITNAVNSSVNISPSSFDCSQLGPQTVTVTASSPSQVEFTNPVGLVADQMGDLFVSDYGNRVIKKITPDGTVTTFAGSGLAGNTDGKGTAASFGKPIYMAIDFDDNIYVIDATYNVIRKIKPDGTVSTFASGFSSLVQGIAIDKANNLFVAMGVQVQKITQAGVISNFAGINAAGDQDGQGTAARFDFIRGMVIDKNGNLYVMDYGNAMIREITPAALVTTIYRFSQYSVDGTLTIDAAGNLFIAAEFNVWELSTAGTASNLVGGSFLTQGFKDGTGSDAEFRELGQITTGAGGNMYVTDQNNNAIREITPAGVVTTFAGGVAGNQNGNIYHGTSASLAIPVVIASSPVIAAHNNQDLPAGKNCNAIIPDYTHDSKVSDICSTAKLRVTQLPTAGTAISLNTPVQIILTVTDGYGGVANTSFTVTSEDEPSIIPKTGSIVLPLDASGTYKVSLTDVAAVTGCTQQPVVTLSPSTFSCADLGPQKVAVTASYKQDAMFNYPSRLSIDALGNLYISDLNNYRVRKISKNGFVSTLAGQGVIGSQNGQGAAASFSGGLLGIANAGNGDTYVCDVHSNLVRKITPDGTVSNFATTALSKFSSVAGNLFDGQAITVDNSGNVYVASSNIVKVTPDGTAALIAQNGMLNPIGNGTREKINQITGLVTDAAGNLYATDSSLSGNLFTNTVYKIAPDGSLTSLVQYTQLLTVLCSPVIDSHGNMFIGSSNSQIFKLTPAGVLSVFAGGEVVGFQNGTGGQALFNNPEGLAIDALDNLYVSDSNNNVIRKVTPAGVVTTLAGTGTAGYADGNIIGGVNTVTQVPVTVTSSLFITSKFNDVILQGNGLCPLLLPDYTKTATAADNCSQVTFTQSPAAGSLISGTDPITVSITASDALNNRSSVSFKVTPLAAPSVAPSLIVTASSTNICEGTSVSFSATPANAGSDLTFQWQVNHIDAGDGQSTFITSALKDQDVVTCTVTSATGCLTVVNSAPIVIKVNTSQPPAITITAGSENICSGTSDEFTANITNGGSNPSYLWQLNGVTVGSQPTYTNAQLNNGDRVSCSLINNDATCLAAKTAISNTITIGVVPFSSPQVSIFSSESGAVCAGTAIHFTSTSLNVINGTYTWYINGISAGNGPAFTYSSFNDGDVVTCMLTSEDKCSAPLTGTSNPVIVHILSVVTPVLTIEPQNLSVCEGTTVNLSAALNIPLTGLVYQWEVNGINVEGNSVSYSTADLKDGDQVTCSISGNAGSCIAPVESLPLTAHINAPPQISYSSNISIKAGESYQLYPVITGHIKSYLWSPAAGLSSTIVANPIATPQSTTNYNLLVTSEEGCQSAFNVVVNVIDPIIIPNAFTPNGDNVNDTWIIPNLNYYSNCSVDVFTRYGQNIFHSKGYPIPWNGIYNGSRLPVGTYYYIVNLKNGIKPLSGFVTIIR